ncbi:MAG TPA: DnaB-like helicase C-terminal domain-containing protein [Gemmatimonadales bacterium]
MRPDEGNPLESLMGRLDAVAPGEPARDTVPSGFPSLDRLLGGGFRRQDLIVLAGDVASGKSALALAMAIRSARLGVPGLFLSGEMSAERVLERALAQEGKASVDDIRQGRLDETTRAAVGAAAVRLRDTPLAIRSLGGQSFDEVREAVTFVPPRGLVVVDSLQLAPSPRPAGRLEERVALAVRALKAIAVERDLAVLAVAQLPRHRATRPDPRPALDDLGALGAVKQDADLVLGLYREEMYRPGQGVEGATELIVLKNRNGPTGFVDLYFYPRWLRFEDLLDP